MGKPCFYIDNRHEPITTASDLAGMLYLPVYQLSRTLRRIRAPASRIPCGQVAGEIGVIAAGSPHARACGYRWDQTEGQLRRGRGERGRQASCSRDALASAIFSHRLSRRANSAGSSSPRRWRGGSLRRGLPIPGIVRLSFRWRRTRGTELRVRPCWQNGAPRSRDRRR
jgi:hypothetical protein